MLYNVIVNFDCGYHKAEKGNKMEEKNLKIEITKLLHELGVPAHIQGHEYLREAIVMIYNEPSLMYQITKFLYPEIAKKYHTSSIRVERAIRHAIEISWGIGNIEVMNDLFSYSLSHLKDKPCNSQYICTIADKLRLEHAL